MTVTLPVPPGVRVTVALVGVTVRPNENSVRETVPLKPLRLLTMIVDVAVLPRCMVREGGVANIVKSGPVTWIWMEKSWVTDPR